MPPAKGGALKWGVGVALKGTAAVQFPHQTHPAKALTYNKQA